MTLSPSLRKYENYFILLGLVLIYELTAYYMNTYILTENFYLDSYLSTLSYDRVEELFKRLRGYQGFYYIAIPLIQVLKFAFISSFIYSAFFLFNVNITFGKVFKAVMYADIIFAVQSLLKPLVYTFFMKASNFKDLRQYAPLSLYQALARNSGPAYLAYAFQSINIFEFAFIFLCAYNLHSASKEINYKTNLRIMFFGYGSFLVFWVSLVTFLIVTYSN